MKRILMVAFHFPPLGFGSGIERTLSFVRHLPEFGWEPFVLSVHPRAYDFVDLDSLARIPESAQVRRAFCVDAKKDLSIRGRYLDCTAMPDRWASWRFDAVRQGNRVLREFKPDVIWSTYPTATAHVIAAALNRRSLIPWIADFRDPMLQHDYPVEHARRRSFEMIEKQTVGQANFSVFAAPGATRDYQLRYRAYAERIRLLENGYDEDSFTALIGSGVASAERGNGPLLVLHSGVIYPSERDPRPFFEALARIARADRIGSRGLRVRFRASHQENLLRSLAAEFRIESLIEVLPPIPHQEALREMLLADGLLILQASNCNAQIPAKLYEYLRAGRPILGLTDPSGDTAATLRKAGVSAIAPLDSAEAIEAVLPAFIATLRQVNEPLPNPGMVAAAARKERTGELAHLLEQAACKGAPGRR